MIQDRNTRDKRLGRLAHTLRHSDATFLLIFAVLTGLAAGYGAVVFRWLIRFFQHWFFDKGKVLFSFMGDYYVIIIPAIGGLIVGFIIYFLARETRGHGVPEVIMSTELVCCSPDENLRYALEKPGSRNIGRAPVTDPKNPNIILGIITRKNIIAAITLLSINLDEPFSNLLIPYKTYVVTISQLILLKLHQVEQQ